MTRSIIASSLKFRVLVVLVAAAVMVVGVLQLRKAPVDVLPEYALPYVEVHTESLGLSATEVESLLTVPLEQDLLNGVKGVETIRSDSVPGLSSIVLTFERGTDILRARQLVNERLSQPQAIPTVSKPPQMLQPVSGANRVMMIGLSTDRLSAIELSVLARWTIRPRLMGLPGVANVAIWGHRDRQLQVQVDPSRLRDRDVSLRQVIETTGNSQLVSPLTFLDASTPGTGGFIDGPNQRLSVRHVLPFGKPDDLARIPIDDSRLKLGDVADVVEDHQPLIGDAIVQGGERGNGLMLVVEKLPGASTLDVTRRVDAAVAELRQGLGGVRMDTTVFRPSSYVHSAIDHLALALAIAGALVVLALAAFLLRWRTVFVAAVAIPLSLVAAALVLDLTEATINLLVLAGLAVAIGVVVDDAAGDVQDIERRLEGRPWSRDGAPTAGAILAASLGRRRSMGFATLVVLLAAAPVLFLGGLDGAFLHPMALAFVLAVLASMLVALTVTPALTLLVMSRPPRAPRDPVLGRALRRRHDGLVGRFAASPRPLVLTVGALLVVGVVALATTGTSLRPSFKDRELLVRWDATPSTSLPEMDRITRRASAELRSVPGVRDVGAHIGRAVSGDQAVGTGSGEMWVTMDDSADYDATLGSIRDVVGGYPGVRGRVLTYESERSRGVFGPSDDGVTVRVFGQDYGVLRREAERLRGVVAGVDGVRDPRVELPADEPTLEVKVDLAAARGHGILPGDVRRAVATIVSGLEVGSFFEQQKVFAVVVRGVPATAHSVDSVRDLLLDAPGGRHVRLGDVASVRVQPTPVDIRHDAVSRYVDVRAAVDGRGVGAVQRDVRRRLRDVAMPLEYHAQVIAESSDTRGGRHLPSLVVASVLGIFLLLQAAFASWRLAAVVLATLPVAVVGGLLVAVLDGGDLSLGELAGLFAVFAIAVRAVVALVRHLQLVEEQDGAGPDAVLRGARERLVPVVVTAVLTACAVLPLALLGDVAGNEITQPFAVVVLGGLVTSTLLAVLLTPALYLHVRRVPAPAPAAAEHRAPAPAAADLPN